MFPELRVEPEFSRAHLFRVNAEPFSQVFEEVEAGVLNVTFRVQFTIFKLCTMFIGTGPVIIPESFCLLLLPVF